MQVDDDTWAEVRRAYEQSAAPIGEIARSAGLTRQRIAARAKKEAWVRAVTQAASTQQKEEVSRQTPKAATRAPLPTRGAQRALIGRLYRAISLKLEHMEKRMASGKARSAQDEERESRALATLINNFEKVTEAVAELGKDRDTQRTGRRASTDAERMRREIADRLERLGGDGPAPGRARKPRS
ncbi:hypothetical protein [Hyphomicrobium sp.]|uniref:hypothetical protein n=1 Tax=Hyphomicrobium sp. TaxID=82 RepID=UPI002E33695A|nr:hypothetical protein [Hyphomicrobium sp.]HEX2843326.1 hypothetical protein [Hyphomicrobium sp.]